MEAIMHTVITLVVCLIAYYAGTARQRAFDTKQIEQWQAYTRELLETLRRQDKFLREASTQLQSVAADLRKLP
jgi:hypothetical protein